MQYYSPAGGTVVGPGGAVVTEKKIMHELKPAANCITQSIA